MTRCCQIRDPGIPGFNIPQNPRRFRIFEVSSMEEKSCPFSTILSSIYLHIFPPPVVHVWLPAAITNSYSSSGYRSVVLQWRRRRRALTRWFPLAGDRDCQPHRAVFFLFAYSCPKYLSFFSPNTCMMLKRRITY